jgi:site-specific DNA-cytosine methylase
MGQSKLAFAQMDLSLLFHFFLTRHTQAAAKSWVKNHPDGRMFCCSVVDILKFIKAKGPDHEATGWKHIFPEDAYWTQPVEEVFAVRFDETKSIGLEYKVRFKDQDEKKWIAADEVADDVNVRIWKKNNEDKWKPLHKRYREVKRYTDKEEEGGAEAELADAEMALDKQEEDIDEDGNAIEVDSDSEGDGHHLSGGQWKVKEIKDIRINKVGQYEYLVGWEGYSGEDDTWEPEQNIRAGTLIEKFLKTAWTKKMYPCKKTVGYIVGGPPCQGFSKANHHRDSKHPFRGKNRGVSHFLEYVSFFEPRGVLVENVAGMLEHGDGVVPRSVMKQLLLWGYQVRIVMASSACYGVPQRRWRVLIIAAKSGEYLPKLPEPTHWVDTSKWITGSVKPVLRAEWSNIILGPKTSGQPWAKCPDIQQAINDLPPYASVDPKGFSLYNSPPRSNYQKLMRQRTLSIHLRFLTLCLFCLHADVKGNILWNNKGRTSSTVYAWKIYEPTHLFVTITCTLRAMNEPAVHPVYQRPMTAREHARAQCSYS